MQPRLKSLIRRFLTAVMLFILAFLPLCGMAQSTPESANTWMVTFDAGSSSIECWFPGNDLQFKAQLSFSTVEDGKRILWSVQNARDFAGRRLALVDPENNVQGYVSIIVDGARMRLVAIPRPPHRYHGELALRFETRFGSQAFACRTRASSQSSVIQIASGNADSLLNDSLFNPERDLVLRVSGKTTGISTHVDENGPVFDVRTEADILETGEVAIELLPHYYRSSYVPNYKLIDRTRCPVAPTGWMSWNAYFDTAGEKENLDEARIGAQFLKPYGLEIWSIESWQDNSPKLPVSDFYNLTLRPSHQKFPHGMKWLADQIRGLGFRPGIWTVPFGTGDSNYYAEHRGWFLHDAKGVPMQNWCGRFLLDPSQAEVRQQMMDTHHKMALDWGYEFFKIDGMSGHNQGYSAHFFERPEVKAAFQEKVDDPYSLCVKALRDGIGPNRIFLACQGHYTGPEVQWADAGRLGADIVSPNQPPHWENYLNQARVTMEQLFIHNIVWYNDPDTLMVAEPAPMGMVRLATTVVALPGQVTFFGDKLGRLQPERMRLLQQSLPVCPTHPMDLFPVHNLAPIWDLKIKRSFASWDVVSVFNWDEAASDRKVVFSELGLPDKEFVVFDFWNKKFMGSYRGQFPVRVEPRANALLAIHEKLDRPQILSTDRHVTQGGVECKEASWDSGANELSSVFTMAAKDMLTVFIHVPQNYTFIKGTVEGGTLKQAAAEGDSLVVASFSRETGGEAMLTLKFDHAAKK